MIKAENSPKIQKNPRNFPEKPENFREIPLKSLKIFATLRAAMGGGDSKIFYDGGFGLTPSLAHLWV